MIRPSLSRRQISPPEAQPSRLAAGQRRDKRLAPQALNFLTVTNGKRDLSAPGQRPTPSASPPPRGEGAGVGGTGQTEAPK
jgi:hypothetical protein